MIFKHPDCQVDIEDFEGNNALKHARSPSLKKSLQMGVNNCQSLGRSKSKNKICLKRSFSLDSAASEISTMSDDLPLLGTSTSISGRKAHL